MSFEQLYAYGLLIGLAALLVAYGLRVLFRGRAHYARVNRQGGSFLLGKSVMEGAYWSLQPLGKLLAQCHVTPNQISWASLVFGLVAGGCLAFGHFGFGAFFAMLASVLDALDGMVARLTGVASDAGEVLDAAVDRAVEFFFLAGLAVYYREAPGLLILTLFAILGSFMVSYSTAKAEALQLEPPKGAMRRPERAVYLTLGALLSPITIPWLEVERVFPMAMGHPMVIALGLVAVIGNLSAIERFYAIARAIRLQEKAAARARAAQEESFLEGEPHHDSKAP